MCALHNLVTGAEQQKRARSIRALRLALTQALVTNESTLLVSNKTTNGHALKWP